MKLQRIISEVQKIPDQLRDLKELFIKTEKIKVVKTPEDIDELNKMLEQDFRIATNQRFDKISLTGVEARFRVSPTFYDSSSSDDFI
jgi:hypothetical protein